MKNRRISLKIDFTQAFELEPAEQFECHWTADPSWMVLSVRMYDRSVALRGVYKSRRGGNNRFEQYQSIVHVTHPNWLHLPPWLREAHRQHGHVADAMNDLIRQLVQEQESS